MSNYLMRLKLRDAPISLHARAIICTGLLLALVTLNIPAAADNGPLYVAPGPSNLISPDVIKQGQNQVGVAGRKLGDLIGNSADALASTANFLQAHGWQRGAKWDEGQPNFAAILEWNNAPIYAKTIAEFADRLAEP